jgi:hypothetical protein
MPCKINVIDLTIELVLGSSGETRAGSTPVSRTYLSLEHSGGSGALF